MKNYDLKIETLIECDGSAKMGYFSYGHHEKAEFIKAVNEDYDENFNLEDVAIEHKYVKTVPYCGTPTMMFCYSYEPAKYYKPITVIEI